MRPATDYVRHAAKLARNLHTEAGEFAGLEHAVVMVTW